MFHGINNKYKYEFIEYDIKDLYSSISVKDLLEEFDYAKAFISTRVESDNLELS